MKEKQAKKWKQISNPNPPSPRLSLEGLWCLLPQSRGFLSLRLKDTFSELREETLHEKNSRARQPGQTEHVQNVRVHLKPHRSACGGCFGIPPLWAFIFPYALQGGSEREGEAVLGSVLNLKAGVINQGDLVPQGDLTVSKGYFFIITTAVEDWELATRM